MEEGGDSDNLSGLSKLDIVQVEEFLCVGADNSDNVWAVQVGHCLSWRLSKLKIFCKQGGW